MWINIICDLEQPLSYLLPAIVITTMGLGVYKMWRKEKVKIVSASVLLIIYIEILMQTAFFSREPGSRKQIELNLFGTWGETSVAHAYFIENIIMFIDRIEVFNDKRVKIHFTFEDVLAGYAE